MLPSIYPNIATKVGDKILCSDLLDTAKSSQQTVTHWQGKMRYEIEGGTVSRGGTYDNQVSACQCGMFGH
jgi:hypothetical protein